MKQAAFYLAILLIVSNSEIYASGKKPWPKQQIAVVQSSVTVRDPGYVYFYRISAAASNEYPVHRFELDLRLNPQQHPLSRSDLTFTHTAGEHMTILENAAKIDVISMSAPEGWGSDYPGLWGVNELVQRYMISPGDSRAIYSITAVDPPSLREFVIEFYSWDFVMNREDYEYPGRVLSRVGDPDELITEVSKGIQYLGKTLAPVKPPEPFTVSSWTARMAADAVEARKLKWIKTDKATRDIKRLIADLNTEDMAKLKAAVKKIEDYVQVAKSKGTLTDEVDALVRLNAQYLLRRLEKSEAIK